MILLVVSAGLFFGLTQTSNPAPNVVFEAESNDDSLEYTLTHNGGDTVDGDKVELQGTADPDTTTGDRLNSGYEVTFYPTAEEVTIVWYDGQDRSYVLTTFTVEQSIPDPDEGCDWVDDQTNGGVDPITIDGIVVSCDVEITEQVKVQDGGAVVGEVVSDSKELDADDAEIYGDADVEKVLNLQNGTIVGDATSRTADVKIQNGDIKGSIKAEKIAEATDDGKVEGDVESQTKDAKILNSVVEGSVTANETVKLQDATVEGDVYVDAADFDCTNSTVNGQSCGSYTPKNPDNW